MRSAPANVLSAATIPWRTTRTLLVLVLLPVVALIASWWLFTPHDSAVVPAAVLSATGVVFLGVHARTYARLRVALQERQVFASLVDNSSDFIGIADPDGNPLYLNPAGRRMVGLSLDHPIAGSRLLDYYAPNERARAEHVILKPTAEDGVWAGRTSFRNWKTEESIPVSHTHFTIRDRDTGRTLGTGTITRDMSERQRIETRQAFFVEVSEILSSTLDYEQTLANIAELAVRDLADFCVVDTVGEQGEVRRLKVAARDPARAWVSGVLENLDIAPPRRYFTEAAVKSMRTIVVEHYSPRRSEELAQNDAHLAALRALDARSAIIVPLVAHGQPVGAIAFISSSPTRVYGKADVPMLEELARRAALSIENARLYRVAQRAIRSRDDVLAIVAHDLRNPLNAIGLQAEMLATSAVEGQRARIEGIERSAARMNRLVEDLLDVARLEEDRLRLDCAAVSVRELLGDSVRAHEALAASASIELVIEAAPERSEIWADRDRVLQILENLIGNAVRFTPSGGCITVGAEARDTSVLFWVADTGSGIEPEHQPHVFDRFWQARGGRHGAGLGLPIVKGLVEAHGGQIWLDSTPGRGSTFWFTIPAQR
jgi:PAS domain S-box-containing protein